MEILQYNRENAVEYAHKWAYSRNPEFYDFETLGGDCTNFISQCILAGGAVMNPKKDLGWYYYGVNSRAPAWSGVPYFYNFITTNKGRGPYGAEIPLSELEPGDILQLATIYDHYHHSPIVVEVGETPSLDNILVAAHTFDADYRPLSSYTIRKMRCIKILGIRK